MDEQLRWGSDPKLHGWDGLNDAAINVFNSNVINSFVREMFQNSNDARDDKLPADPTTGKQPPLEVSIYYRTLTADQFPDFKGFTDIFARIKSAPENKQQMEFFNHGQKALGTRAAIKFFVFEDFNTTGLTGSDDDHQKTFSACVLSEGLTIKRDETAGGSYGIGKNAIFGFSKLRTVLYASLNKDGEYIFQGVAKLACYRDAEKQTREKRIFCGRGLKLKSIRNLAELDPQYRDVFKRSRPGLSQFAACPVNHPDWLNEFTKAILRNYWLLLYNGELVVELKNETELQIRIDKSNLEELLIKFFNPETYDPDDDVEPKGNPYEFYRSFTEGKVVEKSIDYLGKVRFYYRELDHTKSNRIAFIRNGMVVYSKEVWGFKAINYAGVFICESEEGNKILRMMEPPTHDSFAPERLEEKTSKYSVSVGRQIMKQVSRLISDSLEEIADQYKKPAEDIPWLDALLTAITGTAGEGSGSRMNLRSENESPEKIGEAIRKTIAFKSLQKDDVIDHDKGQIIEPGRWHRGPGPGPRPGPTPRPGPLKKKTRIKSRIYRTQEREEVNLIEYFAYKIFLISDDEPTRTDILINQKGDSGNVVSFHLAKANDASGNEISISEVRNKDQELIAYRLSSVTIPGELKIFVSEPYKSSFKIVNT